MSSWLRRAPVRSYFAQPAVRPVQRLPFRFPIAASIPEICGLKRTADDGSNECPICLDDPLASDAALLALPCSHAFHASCVEPLIDRACPLCLAELPASPRTDPLFETPPPPGPDLLFEEATQMYLETELGMGASWRALSKGQHEAIDEATSMWIKAANQGHVGAQYNLGVICSNGHGVKQDHAEAARWYRAAAGQGHAAAQNNLGYMYERGQGVKQDHGEAMHLYQRAAEHGHASAQFHLGVLHEDGHLVERDHAKAVHWFSKAAETWGTMPSAQFRPWEQRGEWRVEFTPPH